MLMKRNENERVHQNIESFFSMKNTFYSLMNPFRSDKNAFFAVPHCYGMVSSPFQIVLHLNRKLSDPFFFGMVRIGSCQNEIDFFNVSIKKPLRMDSSN
jgi:hypothetical protein